MSAEISGSRPTQFEFVPESRFGEWFQRTDIWRRYVVDAALTELASLFRHELGSPVVLDAGCGEGVAFEAIGRLFEPDLIIGIDVHGGAVDAARAAAARLDRPVRVLRADAASLQLDDRSVDIVLCHQLLHHCADPVAVLAELRRVLKRDGWLLVAESCRPFLSWLPVRLLFQHPEREQLYAADYVALVREAGFVVDAERIMTPAPWWSRKDLGLRERCGGRPGVPEATQIRIAARAPEQP